MWAEPLGDDLYKIENVPFYAYVLNSHDIVRATPYSGPSTSASFQFVLS